MLIFHILFVDNLNARRPASPAGAPANNTRLRVAAADGGELPPVQPVEAERDAAANPPSAGDADHGADSFRMIRTAS